MLPEILKCLISEILMNSVSSPFQENQDNASNLVISDTELKQVAYIYKCVNSTVYIKGKINSITVGKCREPGEPGLLFQD